MIKAKKDIRRAVKPMVLSLSAKEREQQSQSVCKRLLELISERQAGCVALFSPLSDEVDISPLAQELMSRGCRVVLPRVGDAADGTPQMEFFDYEHQNLVQGAYGISEPQGECACRTEDIDFMVVPGVAFTADGRRLGRGKGYYDRYLARVGFRAFCVGVCYVCQLYDELPSEPHDRRVDAVVVATDKNL